MFDDFSEFMVVRVVDEHTGNVPCLQYGLKQGRTFERKRLMDLLKGSLPPTIFPENSFKSKQSLELAPARQLAEEPE